MMKIIKKYKNYFILLLSVIIIFCAYLFKNNIHPFGSNNIYFRDMEYQYCYYIYNFKYRLLNGLSLKYSFNSGLGFPFYKLFFTYLSCPLMFLSILFKNIQSFIFIFILFFLVLSSFSMYSYFKYKYKKDNIYYVLIAISYAFSGWIIAYHEHIQWLPVVALLPLIIKYLEKLIDNNKTLGYFITLALSILCNYYLSMFVCVFIVLYYFLYCFINKKLNIKNILLFSLTSLLAGGSISILLVPFLKDASLSTSAGNHLFYTDAYIYNATFIEYLYRLFSYSFIDRVGNLIKGPNISVSIVVLILFFNYLFSKTNNKRKVLYISLLLIYFLPFISIEINFIFNFMRVSNGGFFRHSFIFIFIMCLIAGDSVNTNINPKKLLFIALMLLNIVSLVFIYYGNADMNFWIINSILIILYSLSFIFNRYSFVKYLLVLFIIMELLLSFNLNKMYSNYNYIYIPSDNLSRTEIKMNYDTNSEELFNNSYYNNNYSLASYSSLLYKSVCDFVSKIGLSFYYNHIYYNNDSKVFRLLFNIKNVYRDNELISNEDAIGYMFMINNDGKEELGSNLLENQNIVFKDLTGIDNLYTEITYTSKNIINEPNSEYIVVKYTFDVDEDIYYYFKDNTIFGVNDGKAEYSSINHDGYEITDLAMSKTGIIYVYYKDYNENKTEGKFYIMNKDKYNQGYNYLKKRVVDIKVFKEDYIKGIIETNEKGTIYTSIPYDEGWKVYVNGKEIDTYKYKDTFLMFDIPEGNNTIELKYSINHLETGIILSIISLVSYGLLYYLEKRKHS